MRPDKIKKSVTLDSDIVEAIDAMAEEDDRSFSQYINGILRQWVEFWEEAPGKPHEKGLEARARTWMRRTNATFGVESLDEKERS